MTTASSHSAGSTAQPLIEETIGTNLSRTADRFAERDALIVRHQGIRLTYAELHSQVDAVARGLLAYGLEKGDRVGIWAPNCAEWVLTQYATAKVGAILVNINPAYRATELQYVLAQSGCRLLIAAQSFKTSSYVEILDSVRESLPALERVTWLGTDGWDELVRAGEQLRRGALEQLAASLSADDPINIQYTSGTTGFPKGATLSHRNILNNGYFVGEGCRYTENDRICIPVPYYHCFGMVMGNLGATTHGSCMVVPAPSFDPDETLAAVAEERCTSLYGVPTMFIAMLDRPLFATSDLSSLRTGIMAGSPCPIEIMRRVIDDMNMHEVTICYGMTETSPVSTQTTPEDPLEKRVGTVGRTHPHVEVKVINPADGTAVARDNPGELCTRGYSVMLGYWDDPVRTKEAVDDDGWMHTGDLATMDADGYINIVGRSKDVIIRGGENVYPREIEEFLYSHPGIRDVQVIGVPDARYGEVIMAWVIPQEATQLTVEQVRDYCQGNIAHFKVPRYIKVVEGFPMTVTGKVQKYKMREQAIEELGLAGHIQPTA